MQPSPRRTHPHRTNPHRTHPRRNRRRFAARIAALGAFVLAAATLTVGPVEASTDPAPPPANVTPSEGAHPPVTAANDHAMGSTIPKSLRQQWKNSTPRVHPMASAPQGVDVSNNNGYINWDQVDAAGIDFAMIKATEGTYFIDASFDHNYLQSYYHGIIRGAYHFANPADSSGATQARFFVNHGGGWSGDGLTLPPMLDIEYNPYGPTCYNLTDAQMVNWISDFSNTVKDMTGRYPLVYTTTNWWSQCTGNYGGFGDTSPLVIANWGSDPYPLPNG